LGLPADTPLGDPGLLVPLLQPISAAPRTAGRTVCMPHINDPLGRDALLALAGTDELLDPEVTSMEALSALLDDIAGADFVLSGSLHGAIIAAAYGRPFAFWNTGHIDVPFKWRDFAASIGHDASFVSNLAEGRAHHAAQTLKLPPYAPILGCAPYAVRTAIWAKALAADAGLAPDVTAALVDAVGAPLIEAPAFVAAARRPDPDARRGRLEGVQAERRRARATLQRLRDRLAEVEWSLDADLSVSGFDFERDGEMSFAAGRTGASFVDHNWTSPNEVGPWTLGPIASLTLPEGLGWETADALTFRGYLFAPHHAEVGGRRRVRVNIDDVWVYDEVVDNPDPESESVFTHVRCPIPRHVRDQAGGLTITFVFEPIGSPKALGLSLTDDRPIGFAPTAAQAEYG